jgi:hypothetical protein
VTVNALPEPVLRHILLGTMHTDLLRFVATCWTVYY